MIILNICFAQSNLADKPIFILKLSNGTEKITRDPILLGKQSKNFESISLETFNKTNKNISGNSVFLFELDTTVKKLLTTEDIFNNFKIPKQDRKLPIIIVNRKEVIDAKSIIATENSIESVKVDKNQNAILIKTYPDASNLR